MTLSTQKMANSYTKEGVIINTFAKGGESPNLKDSYDSLIISDETKLPKQLNENFEINFFNDFHLLIM